jgi:molybdate transport system ATP-binding protein
VAAGDVNAVSLTPALRGIVGPDAAGAVVEGRVVAIDAASELATIAIGDDVLRVASRSLALQQSIRVQLLARDLILAIEEPRGLSVRNQLRGRVRSITADGSGDLIEVDVGGVTLLARITAAATRELRLAPGTAVWVLVKAVSFNPHDIGAAGTIPHQ